MRAGNKLPAFDFLFLFNARNIVFMAMIAVGALCIFMSASNTTSYLGLTGMSHSIALMTGIALVVFSSTSATAAQLFLGQKAPAKVFSVPFIVVGLIVIVFSIFSTLSLNYNKFVNSDAIQADIHEQIDKKRNEIVAAQSVEGDDSNKWAKESIDRLLSLSEKSGESWNNSMKTIMETAQNLGVAEQTRIENLYVETLPKTFFGFMLGLKSLNKKYFFDFFMIAIPAIFYDLIAPLAVTIVLFLMGFKNKNSQKIEVKPDEIENRPEYKEIAEYINNAVQDDYSLLADEDIPKIDSQNCKKAREFLMSFVYKNRPVIEEKEGQLFSIFDKEILKRFIALQYNVQRVN
jgi:hypothetical protein